MVFLGGVRRSRSLVSDRSDVSKCCAFLVVHKFGVASPRSPPLCALDDGGRFEGES